MHNPLTENRTDTLPGTSPATQAVTRSPLYVGSEVYRRAAFSSNHPLKIMRHSAVLDLVGILDWLSADAFRNTQPASIDQLAKFHDRGYIEALQYAESAGMVSPEIRDRYNIGTLENPVFEGLFERAATTVGGSILAAELACDGHTVFHPSGGTHHGLPDRAHGFCYFNDPVFAIRTFLGKGMDRVLYVDLDAHHGDGVEAAFFSEPRVLTVSIHEAERWPYTGSASDRGAGNARNLPVPRGVNDSELDYLIENAVLPLAESFAPDALVLCCGADCLAGDPLSGMQLSNVALWRTIDRLLELRRPTVILGGGGYNPWTVTRYWTGLWGRINGEDIPATLPAAAQAFLATMECDLVDEEDVEPAWLTTMADTPYPGPIRDEVRSIADTVMR
jgi:acetoin utilization protein AcuC